MPPPSDRYVDVARQFREASGGESLTCDPATPEQLAAAQEALGCRFPDSYVWFQLEFGDVANGSLDIYTVRPLEAPNQNIVAINLDERREAHPALPAHLIAFSDNGGGDFCCFDTSAMKDGETLIVWWDHESDEHQIPEPAAASFLDWIETELRERAEEEPHSLLENMGPMYQSWLAEWLKKK
jgi:hypothetical protein